MSERAPSEAARGRERRGHFSTMAYELEYAQPKVFDNRVHDGAAQLRRLIPAELLG
jgi:hypothetical protein